MPFLSLFFCAWSLCLPVGCFLSVVGRSGFLFHPLAPFLLSLLLLPPTPSTHGIIVHVPHYCFLSFAILCVSFLFISIMDSVPSPPPPPTLHSSPPFCLGKGFAPSMPFFHSSLSLFCIVFSFLAVCALSFPSSPLLSPRLLLLCGVVVSIVFWFFGEGASLGFVLCPWSWQMVVREIACDFTPASLKLSQSMTVIQLFSSATPTTAAPTTATQRLSPQQLPLPAHPPGQHNCLTLALTACCHNISVSGN